MLCLGEESAEEDGAPSPSPSMMMRLARGVVAIDVLLLLLLIVLSLPVSLSWYLSPSRLPSAAVSDSVDVSRAVSWLDTGDNTDNTVVHY